MDQLIPLLAVLIVLLALGATAATHGVDSRPGIGDQHSAQR